MLAVFAVFLVGDTQGGAAPALTTPPAGTTIISQENYFLGPNLGVEQTFIAQQTPAPDLVLSQAPASGAPYKIRRGDSLFSIARRFKVEVSLLKDANKITDETLIRAGETLIIPGVTSAIIAKAAQDNPPAPAYVTAKMAIGNGLLAPITGYNWGKLHPTNAVDIANDCGTPIYAANDGVITMARYGWNGGGGNTVEVTSPRGFATRYGHMDTIYVTEGANVRAGDLIGLVGNNGLTTGYTGCHVHFEVRGMTNPLERY